MVLMMRVLRVVAIQGCQAAVQRPILEGGAKGDPVDEHGGENDALLLGLALKKAGN